MSAKDLTIQADLAPQHDASLLKSRMSSATGTTNYVISMADLPVAEQDAFPGTHSDLYERSYGQCGCASRTGQLAIGSLGGVGFARGATPEWGGMREIE